MPFQRTSTHHQQELLQNLFFPSMITLDSDIDSEITHQKNTPEQRWCDLWFSDSTNISELLELSRTENLAQN
jgi:hypothetical protein